MTGMSPLQPRLGSRILLESERAARPARGGMIAAVVHGAVPSYRVLWDDGHTSILTPASGCALIAEDAALGGTGDETIFRAINDRIRAVANPWLGMYEFVCECVDGDCTSTMRLSPLEYDNVRTAPGQFALIPGHERSGGEDVVLRTDRYVVVQR